MPEQDQGAVDAPLEECIDELDVAIENLKRFPQAVLAFAMRVHLAALLRAMADAGELGQPEIREFLTGLEAELLQA
jgi:hypothetical protein